jgi:hypothetical protein
MNAETIIQNQIRIALSKYGICFRLNAGHFKTIDGRMIKAGLAGLPDLLWIGPDGRTAWLEVKTGAGKVREHQQRFIDRLTEMGQVAGIVRSVDDALRMIGVIE